MVMDLQEWIGAALDHQRRWEAAFGPYEPSAALEVDEGSVAAAFADLFERLEDNYPFFHPRYAGQMLKPPHPAAVVAYLAAMLVNPNNHALDGGPATARMEVEAVARLAEMIGFGTHLGHLTTSGTIANLEALFVARSVHPDRGVAFSDQAHYTHGRMCHLLGMAAHPVGSDDGGRIDLDRVAALARAGAIGTVVVTTGSTGLGAVDRVEEAVRLKERYGLRVHVDGAYGGFYAIVAKDAELSGALQLDPAPWKAIAACDSFVVDPHKHGLQPYGCGAVLFSDPGVARYYSHESPYTYFTGGGVGHLGEISLECSRAGAAAAAFWLTLRLFPLSPDGLGRVLSATRRAAQSLASGIDSSQWLCLYQRPELDIVTYFSRRASSLAAVDASSAQLLSGSMAAADAVFLSTLRVPARDMVRRHPRLASPAGTPDSGHGVRLLRSVLMKPESEPYARVLLDKLEARAAAL
ncbi:MAG TPA: aminotransferase class I/II-fold pyridoxal phosphate-dependent enzyme [Acidimicrobiales bacterium]|nr:aminotransferase class I/II-fold pyridoxal phosphate-dependent enzyme [Acidimicrobiales bacterium]